MNAIVLSCKTQKLFKEIPDATKPWLLKLSTAVTYNYKDNNYKFWTYLNQNELLNYLNGNYVIGFNNISFDCPLLLGETHKLDVQGNSSNDKYSWSNYDIYIEIKRKLTRTTGKPIKEAFEAMKRNFSLQDKGVYTLDSICYSTLNYSKTRRASYTELFKQKKILELIESNLEDTRSIKMLYDFIKKYKYLINLNFDVIKF